MENFLRFNTLMENIYLGDDSLHCTPETDTYELSWSQTVTLIGDLIILIAALPYKVSNHQRDTNLWRFRMLTKPESSD